MRIEETLTIAKERREAKVNCTGNSARILNATFQQLTYKNKDTHCTNKK